ncbi:MAG: hypothetical protein ABW110_24130 [Steroidobacteraceae bacterium]
MAQQRRSGSSGILALALLSTLAACSSGSSDSDSGTPPGSNDQPATIEGVATPSSVSVVTATNAS